MTTVNKEDLKEAVANFLVKSAQPATSNIRNDIAGEEPMVTITENDDGSVGSVEVKKGVKNGLAMAEYMVALAMANQAQKQNKGTVIEVLDATLKTAKNFNRLTGKKRGQKSFLGSAMAKEVTLQIAENGGFLVPDVIYSDFIELLRHASVVRNAGAQKVTMSTGALKMNGMEQGAFAEYGDDCDVPFLTDVRFNQKEMKAHKLRALIPICNDFIRYADRSNLELIRNDLLAAVAEREDRAFLRGNGTNHSPKGLRYLADPANVFPRSLDGGSVTLQTVANDLRALIGKVECADVPVTRGAYFMSCRTKQFLATLMNGNGIFIYESILQGTLNGYPVYFTNNIPDNLGVAGDESEIYFVAMNQIIIGDAINPTVELNSNVNIIHPATGNTCGWSTDDSVMRVMAAHDIMARHDGKEIAILTEVDWGA